MSEIKRTFHNVLEGLFEMRDRKATPGSLDLTDVYLVADINQGGFSIAEEVWHKSTMDVSAAAATKKLLTYADTEEHLHRLVAMTFFYPAGGTSAISLVPQITTPAGNSLSVGYIQNVAVGTKVYSHLVDGTTTVFTFGGIMGLVIPTRSEFSIFTTSGGAGATAVEYQALFHRVPRNTRLPQ